MIQMQCISPGSLNFPCSTGMKKRNAGMQCTIRSPHLVTEDLANWNRPSGARAQAYDLVINGFEAGGGTIRIHDGEVQSKVFRCSG